MRRDNGKPLPARTGLPASFWLSGAVMKRPWMPLYVGDYLAKTTHLTTEQHGAYLLLILHYWANGGLPHDENQLMAIAKMDAGKWYGNRVAIAKFFDKDWRHTRIDEELAKAKNISDKRALAGLKGAWSKHGRPVGNVWQMPTQSQSHIDKGAFKK